MINPDGSHVLEVGEVYLVVGKSKYAGFVVEVVKTNKYKYTQGVTGTARVLKVPDKSWKDCWYGEEWGISALYVGDTYRLLNKEEAAIYLMSE